MGSFEKVNSGMSGLDNMLDYMRLGDNVVWQVSSLDDYMLFTESFARQAVKDAACLLQGRYWNVNYRITIAIWNLTIPFLSAQMYFTPIS